MRGQLRLAGNIFGAIFAFLFVLAAPTLGAGMDWSFKDHPWPGDAGLTRSEKAYLATPDDPALGDACQNETLKRFHIYNDRYPAFAAHGNVADRLFAWKAYLARDPHNLVLLCFIITDEFALGVENMPKRPADFYYCGHFSRPPRTEQEKTVKRLINALMAYTRSGTQRAAEAVLFENQNTDWIRLDPSLAYYLSQLDKPLVLPATRTPDTGDPGKTLTPERRAFLQKAARNGDLDAVLATVPACAPALP